MTVQQMHDWFDLIQDKYSSPYFTDTEKDTFLTRAQYQYVNELFPIVDSPVNVESNINSVECIATLIIETDSPINPSATGKILTNNISTEVGSDYMRLLNISVDNGVERVAARFRRHNDFYKLEKNSFKAGSNDVPVYKIVSDGIILAPANTSYGVYFTVIKEPEDIQLGVTEPELPAHTHDKVVAIALELAGVASRDEALMVINQ